jgi:hypothetical protein
MKLTAMITFVCQGSLANQLIQSICSAEPCLYRHGDISHGRERELLNGADFGSNETLTLEDMSKSLREPLRHVLFIMSSIRGVHEDLSVLMKFLSPPRSRHLLGLRLDAAAYFNLLCLSKHQVRSQDDNQTSDDSVSVERSIAGALSITESLRRWYMHHQQRIFNPVPDLGIEFQTHYGITPRESICPV